MTPERWQQVKTLFERALQHEPVERSDFVAKASAGDVELQREVLDLLEALEHGGDLLEQPVAKVAVDLLADGPDATGVCTMLVGRSLGPYHLLRELGRGGMATVFLAQDPKHDRLVALKVLRPELAATLGTERFLREIKLTARLQHPHILPLFDSGETEGWLWYTMPFIEGESLRARLEREKQLPLADALRIAREVADALAYAHQRGVVHRDIKPENILLEAGEAVVADFGIARAISAAGGDGSLTAAGATIGTPAYMSPEQATAGRDVDGRSDIYSLGCVLYEMLSGHPPFLGSTAHEILLRQTLDPVPPLRSARATVPKRIERVVNKALAKVPADRFATASEFAEALAGGTAASGVLEALRPSRRAALAALGVALVGALGGVIWERSHRGTGTAAATATTERVGPKRVAVLPFDNVGQPEDDYFADGMSDEVRGKLASLPGLEVIARASSSQYKKSAKQPQQIAKELGVEYLLTGTVRWQKGTGGASRVEVVPELVRVAGRSAPTTAWQEPFDAELADVFQVQADIAGRVANALHIALSAGNRQSFSEKPTRNLAAYDAFLKGEAIVRSSNDPVSSRRAAGFYEQAVALDSTFALAWAKLSRAHSYLYAAGARSSAEAGAARQAAERAVALAANLPEARVALANYYRAVTRDNTRALEQYRLALRLAPNDPTALRGLARLERTLGRWELALQRLQHAEAIDPRSVGTIEELAYVLLWLRRYPEALATADRGLVLAPADLQLIETEAMVYLAQGDLARARAVLRASPKEVDPTALVAFLATYWDLYWVLDDEQQQLLLRLTPRPFDNDRAIWALSLAETHALRGNAASARAYADTARAAYEAQLKDAPNEDQLHGLHGVALAYLGRDDEAVREGKRAVSLLPVTKDADQGAYNQFQLVRIYLLVGEHEKALNQLEPLLKMPYYLSPGWLKVDPTFNPLRGNPRFERLIAVQSVAQR